MDDPKTPSENVKSVLPEAPPPTQKRSQERLAAPERRAQIIEAACREFGRHGFKGATTKALSKAANTSEATIFKHFSTKADLFLAAFEETTGAGTEVLVRQLQDLADQGDDAGLFQTLTRAIFWGFWHNRNLHRMLLYAELETDPATQTTLAEVLSHNRINNFLTAHVAKRQAEGTYRAGDPAGLAACLLAMPVSLAQETYLFAKTSAEQDTPVASPLAVLSAELLLDAIRVRPKTDDDSQ
jgi:AcrR family transcriptional regulator